MAAGVQVAFGIHRKVATDMSPIIRRLVPRSIRAYFHDLQHRVTNLETALDVLLFNPTYAAGDDVGFNGQKIRKQIFRDLMTAFSFEVILETGTWIGNTSAYMAQTSGLPVHTCELNQRFHRIAQMRLAGVTGIHFALADSRRFLEDAARSQLAKMFTFFYLDAHWYDDLPLAGELDLIERNWQNFVVLIDDFQVPGDEGYGYDVYGGGLALSSEYIADILKSRRLEAFYPACSSVEETGGKRGCVVITRQGDSATRLRSVASLRAA
jgi:predicted O-methyltransferase YrrM